jgi:hypothetical protein
MTCGVSGETWNSHCLGLLISTLLKVVSWALSLLSCVIPNCISGTKVCNGKLINLVKSQVQDSGTILVSASQGKPVASTDPSLAFTLSSCITFPILPVSTCYIKLTLHVWKTTLLWNRTYLVWVYSIYGAVSQHEEIKNWQFWTKKWHCHMNHLQNHLTAQLRMDQNATEREEERKLRVYFRHEVQGQKA